MTCENGGSLFDRIARLFRPREPEDRLARWRDDRRRERRAERERRIQRWAATVERDAVERGELKL